MGLPRSKLARKFCTAGKQRFADGELLLDKGRTSGAVYLAGYGVECMLKALVLSSTPESQHDSFIERFRGQAAHDYESLLQQLRGQASINFPPDLQRFLVRVSSWSPALRYEPGTMKRKDADAFFEAAARLIHWADERI